MRYRQLRRGENLAAGLNGQSLFLFAGDQKDADAIYANPLLAHLPAVAGKRLPLGTGPSALTTSALLVLQRLQPVRLTRATLSGRALGLHTLPGGAALARPTMPASPVQTVGPVRRSRHRASAPFVDNFRALETAQLAQPNQQHRQAPAPSRWRWRMPPASSPPCRRAAPRRWRRR